MLYSLFPTSAAAAYSHSASVGNLYSGNKTPEVFCAYTFVESAAFLPFLERPFVFFKMMLSLPPKEVEAVAH